MEWKSESKAPKDGRRLLLRARSSIGQYPFAAVVGVTPLWNAGFPPHDERKPIYLSPIGWKFLTSRRPRWGKVSQY